MADGAPLRPIGALVSLACVLACSASSHGGVKRDAAPGGSRDAGAAGDASEPGLTAARFFEARRRLMCEWRIRCGTPDARQEICHPGLEDAWERQRAEALVLGTATFDTALAARCLDAIEGAVPSCASQLSDAPGSFADRTGISDACSEVFRGTLREDEECTGFHFECAGEALCLALELRPTLMRCHTLRHAGDGEPCVHDFDCGPDFRSSFDFACERADCETGGACRRLGDVGGSCEPVEVGSTVTEDCRSGLECRDGLCAERPDLGEACPAEWGHSCREPWMCDGGTCTLAAAQGERCELPTTFCRPGLACRHDPLGTCRSTDGADPGDACWADYMLLGSSCEGELICADLDWAEGFVRNIGVCRAPLPSGAPCTAAHLCPRGHVCASGTCRPMALPGEVCDGDGVCPLHHTCTGGRCLPLPIPGEACTPTPGCLKGACVDGVCCLLPDGQSCAPDPRGTEWDACAGRCAPDGVCQPWLLDCVGCEACWPSAYRCALVCAG